MALLEFLKSNRDMVLGLTVAQIVSTAGDGYLRDGSTDSNEFRSFLHQAPIDSLFGYIHHCLEDSIPRSGSLLQNLINELGGRSDFEVEDGLYQGRKNAIGFDGI